MAITIPNRLLPNTLFGAIFTFVGVGAGFASGCLLHFERFRISHLVSFALFCLAILCVRQVWHKGAYGSNTRRIAFLSPRLLAVILGACLIIGVAMGALVSFVNAAGIRNFDADRTRNGVVAQNPPWQ